jgi:uncharacterized membrane protein
LVVVLAGFFAGLDFDAIRRVLAGFFEACILLFFGVTLVVTVVVAFASGVLVVTVFVLLAVFGAAMAGDAIRATAATDPINVFIASSSLRQETAGESN